MTVDEFGVVMPEEKVYPTTPFRRLALADVSPDPSLSKESANPQLNANDSISKDPTPKNSMPKDSIPK
jgi:hypothetical protein